MVLFSFYSSSQIAVLLERYDGGQLTIPFIGIVMLGRSLLFFTSFSFIVTFTLSMIVIKSVRFRWFPAIIPMVFLIVSTLTNEGRVFLALSSWGWFGFYTAQFASAIKKLIGKDS
jgi:hypothetical protein